MNYCIRIFDFDFCGFFFLIFFFGSDGERIINFFFLVWFANLTMFVNFFFVGFFKWGGKMPHCLTPNVSFISRFDFNL